ncbi:MAG: hypothetical protein K2H15_09415 [Muribaculaceae bacterium]|nr:hypothetical protein [Muribaculaceae bacterium]
MIILLWCMAIIQWALFLYLPIAGLYGIIRLTMEPDITATICSPFLGIKKVSLKYGFIAWMAQAFFLSIVIYDLLKWKHLGINPLIRMW